MNAFAAVIEILFADPNIGGEAIYTSDGGAPALVRIVARRADAVTEFGDARLWSETFRFDVRGSDLPNPRPQEQIQFGDETFLIQGEPVRDRDRLLWTIEAAPA